MAGLEITPLLAPDKLKDKRLDKIIAVLEKYFELKPLVIAKQTNRLPATESVVEYLWN